MYVICDFAIGHEDVVSCTDWSKNRHAIFGRPSYALLYINCTLFIFCLVSLICRIINSDLLNSLNFLQSRGKDDRCGLQRNQKPRESNHSDIVLSCSNWIAYGVMCDGVQRFIWLIAFTSIPTTYESFLEAASAHVIVLWASKPDVLLNWGNSRLRIVGSDSVPQSVQMYVRRDHAIMYGDYIHTQREMNGRGKS
jgi:hypothetical protein